jgi:hypothetical protein
VNEARISILLNMKNVNSIVVKDGLIITAWLNAYKDRHKTLNKEKYLK